MNRKQTMKQYAATNEIIFHRLLRNVAIKQFILTRIYQRKLPPIRGILFHNLILFRRFQSLPITQHTVGKVFNLCEQ